MNNFEKEKIKEALDLLENFISDRNKYGGETINQSIITVCNSAKNYVNICEGEDLYWDANDPDSVADDPKFIVEEHGIGDIIELKHAKRLPNKFGVWVTEKGEDFHLCNTYEEANHILERKNNGIS